MFENGDPLALALEAAEGNARRSVSCHRIIAVRRNLAYAISVLTSTPSSSSCCCQEQGRPPTTDED
jgi:hypothetical protein